MALVADRRELGEADRVVVLLCRNNGKLSAVAPSARRSRRRFGGCLELFARIQVSLTDRGRGGLWRLEEASLLGDHAGLRTDLVAIAHAGYLTELTSALLREGEEASEIFDLLAEALEALGAGPLSASGLRRYELALLERVGLAPAFDACTGCGVQRADGWHFDPDAGGLRCPTCAKSPWATPLSEDSLGLLRHLGDAHEPEAASLAAMGQVRNLLAGVIDRQVGRPLKARQFLRQLAADSGNSE